LENNSFRLVDGDFWKLLTGKPPVGTINIHNAEHISYDIIYRWFEHQAEHDWWEDYADYFGIRDEYEKLTHRSGLFTFRTLPRNLQLTNIIPTPRGEVTFFANSKVNCEADHPKRGAENYHHFFICWKYIEQYCPQPFVTLENIASWLERKLVGAGYNKRLSNPEVHGCPCVENDHLQSDIYHEHIVHMHSLYSRRYTHYDYSI
jgi:hypothetical protein